MKDKGPLEKAIEGAFLRYMWKAYPKIRTPKLAMISQRSWPDRIVFLPNGHVLLIEFKRKGEKPTPLQAECHDYLRSLGHDIKVFDDAREAVDYVSARLREYGHD